MEETMNVHFENQAAAVEHLTSNGWHQIKNGNWISGDGSCAAHIVKAHGDFVLVQAWAL